MKVIGITGGVGCGKSSLLDHLQTHYACRIIKSDEAAHAVEAPGGACHEEMAGLLASYDPDKKWQREDGSFDRKEVAALLFKHPDLLQGVNDLVHPAVKNYILEEVAKEREKGMLDFFFIEAAMLIENGFLQFVDEMWYIYCQKEIRIQRLAKNRGYSREKAESIMAAQLSEEEFRQHCQVVIDNSGDVQSAFLQADRELMRIKESGGMTK